MSTSPENMVKIGQIYNWSDVPIFADSLLSLVNSGITGPKHTKFSLDVEGLLPVLTCPSAFKSSSPLWNTTADVN